jgi:hypothetical protein
MSKCLYDNYPCHDTDRQLNNTFLNNIKMNVKQADNSHTSLIINVEQETRVKKEACHLLSRLFLTRLILRP